MNLDLENIKDMIYVIRKQKVMLDSDLAKLYGVETKRLIEQVKRNLERFPEDFMFICSSSEIEALRSQIATSKSSNSWKHKRRTAPMVFTENGVAMLSTVLNSKQAIQINIAIMRIFTKLRSFLLLEKELVNRIDSLENDTTKVFKVVFEKLDNLERQIPTLRKDRAKIGLNIKG
ncbi:hypothetical protein A9Q84_09555 [Halobacteriovorax marinus]|uniref:KilA-N DNA-binding domain-containing protein n=1 Tax=Halobacteriovorax marinus TaxID=97084 RepID=A0A1Y5F6Q7_9BACT|nr:hypothetical protein A9Q84_09555 [Halobacteriovorax marinus]